MTLLFRLNLLVCALILLGFVLLTGRTLVDARSLTIDEMESTASLVSRFIRIPGSDASLDSPEFYEQLRRLNEIRHVEVRIESNTRVYPDFNGDVDDINAPGWFVNLVRPDVLAIIATYPQPNGDTVYIVNDPTDEIEEVWRDLKSTLVLGTGILLLIVLLMYALIKRWLKQVHEITLGLERAGNGDFSQRIPTITLPEFDEIGRGINRLTAILGTRTAENERLNRKSLAIQEHEKRMLAQELHDSLGQSISAIKAIAVSIQQRSKTRDDVTATSAASIEQIASSSYHSVRILMSTLRPTVLDELGLVPALRQMVDEWNDNHEDSFCRLKVDGGFDDLHEEQRINLYRIVQESLTNAARHAQAENVRVELSGRDIITLLIQDDGVGFNPKAASKGMGLTGLRDRVQILHGELTYETRPGKGVTIQVKFPRHSRRPRRRFSDRKI